MALAWLAIDRSKERSEEGNTQSEEGGSGADAPLFFSLTVLPAMHWISDLEAVVNEEPGNSC